MANESSQSRHFVYTAKGLRFQPVTGSYRVPTKFVTNNSLERRFVQTLLRRAQQALEIPLDEDDNFNWMPGTGHILQA